jgi:diguanylate cyclase (GGDEF)-like protein
VSPRADEKGGRIELAHLIDVGLWQSMLDSMSGQLEAGITVFDHGGEIVLQSGLASLCNEAMKRKPKHPACFRCCDVQPAVDQDRGEFALCPYCDRMINFAFALTIDDIAAYVVVGPVWIAEKETPATLTRLARKFGIGHARFAQSSAMIKAYSLEDFRKAGEMVHSTMRAIAQSLCTGLELGREVGELKQSLLAERKKSWQQMVRDKLTGTYRYNYGLSRLKQEVARAERYKHPLSIVVIGIGQFRSYVDRYGPGAVKTLLGDMGKVVQSKSRRTDVSVRLREEEFLLVLPFTSEQGARAVLERIHREVEGLPLFDEEGKNIEPPSLVEGLATYPRDGDSERDLLRNALEKVRQ